MKSIPRDDRSLSWREFEHDIQIHATGKDQTFRLDGPWKQFVREQDGFRVYRVDGEWIRNNLSVIFGHGGHGFVHEFIPLDEIWVSTHHYVGTEFNECGCDLSYPNQPVSPAYFDSTVLHEITERIEMEKGVEFWIAHHRALDAERKAKYLPDPFDDRIIN